MSNEYDFNFDSETSRFKNNPNSINNNSESFHKFKDEVNRIQNELDRDGKYRKQIFHQHKLLKSIVEWIERKLFALITVSLAIFTIYYSNFFKNLFHNENINTPYFYIAMALYIGALAIFFYLCVYLPHFKNIEDDQWDTYCPNAIPTATLCGVLAMITVIIAIYPVWGLLSIPMLLIMKLGLVMFVNFIPFGEVGSFIFVLIVLISLTSGFYIEHEGYLH
jgi:hypothetical protein